MTINIRISQGERAPVLTFSIALVVSSLLTTLSQADPTLVVDVDTGAMEVYVGDDGLSLPKPVVGCSWAGGGSCAMTLVPGDWPNMDSFEITSALNSLSGDGGTPDILDVLFGNTAGGYSEITFGTPPTFSDGITFPLTPTYNTGVDARDLKFASDLSSSGTTQWNTLYIGIPEPSSFLLVSSGLVGVVLRRRR